MLFVVGLIFVIFLSPLDSIKTTCQRGKANEFEEGQCPIKLSSLQTPGDGGFCVTVRVWIKDFRQAPVIRINSPCYIKELQPTVRRKCRDTISRSNSSTTWEVTACCVKAQARHVVSAFFITKTNTCSVSYTIPAPTPNFHLSVNRTSKSVSVTVETERNVTIRWCYQHGICRDGRSSKLDPAKTKSVLLHLPLLLPCICVEVYYTYTDAKRKVKCPFVNDSLSAATDVLRSSNFIPFDFSVQWKFKCPTENLQISASLCWRHHAHLCTPVLNSTLKETKTGLTIAYDTSAVDKHPQMCLQLSLHQKSKISCPFDADSSSWEASIEPSKQSVFVHLTTSTSATFSAQLCVLKNSGCEARGQVLLLRLEGNDSRSRLAVPLHAIADKPCVQVWQSSPALQGRRILCPNYSPRKSGLIAAAALFVITVLILLVICCHSSAKNNSTADWLHIQKPVLLVCSSDQAPHISAACALASILQGELGATVHMTLWTQSSGRPSGSGAGVADLGPLPWLYGQWDAVQEADGSILIIWSPEAKHSYRKWKELKVDATNQEMGEEIHRRQRENEDYDTAIVQPVFTAALSCLKGALQEGKSQRVSIVYFEGLGHRKDIPKAFRSFPRYCIPQHFSGLLQELGGIKSNTNTRWRCWTRLVVKMMSFWLSRQLQSRLKTLLPQVKDEKVKKCPLVAKNERAGVGTEHEPLHERR